MAEKVFVKYCPICGGENLPNQAFCQECEDGDLSTVKPEIRRKRATTRPAPAENQKNGETPPPSPSTKKVINVSSCMLESVESPEVRISVLEGQTVGRTAKADIVLTGVPKLEWISNVHAKFLRHGEQWYVQHLGKTNYIKVDGDTYRGEEEVALHDGSIVILSLSAFRVTFPAD